MSLLGVYQREIVPDIEENHTDISEGGRFKVVELNQEGSYGPHRYLLYLREISEDLRQRN